METCRYLAAKNAYDKLLAELQPASDGQVQGACMEKLKNSRDIQVMLERAAQVQHSLDFVDTGDDWIHGADMFGTHTFYKKCDDDPNAIVVKIEGTMDGLPLFEQMAVIHEIDLYHEWAPFCTDSILVEKIGKAELNG